MAGKWHCNSEFNSPKQPQPGDFGFDHWLATQNNAAPSHQHPNNYVRNGQPIGPTDEFSCQIAASEVIDWLKNRRDPDQPFFCFVPFHEPHEPVASPDELVEQYRKVAENENQAQYFANVANLDLAVGRLVKALDELDERENTLIIFTSDNGPETLNRYRGAQRSYGQPGPLRGMKLHTTEAGFRVAGIMNWKGRIKAGQTVSTPVSSLDFLPTFCRLAEAKIPANLKLDGTDFLPAIDDKPIQRPQPLVWAYYNALNDARVAMRDGNYKVLAKLNGGKLPKMQNITVDSLPMVRDAKLTDVEVYFVSKDSGESENLSLTDAPLAARMGAKLEAAYRELVSTSHVW